MIGLGPYSLSHDSRRLDNIKDNRLIADKFCRAGFRGAHGAQGPRPPTKPFNFYFALTIG